MAVVTVVSVSDMVVVRLNTLWSLTLVPIWTPGGPGAGLDTGLGRYVWYSLYRIVTSRIVNRNVIQLEIAIKTSVKSVTFSRLTIKLFEVGLGSSGLATTLSLFTVWISLKLVVVWFSEEPPRPISVNCDISKLAILDVEVWNIVSLVSAETDVSLL